MLGPEFNKDSVMFLSSTYLEVIFPSDVLRFI